MVQIVGKYNLESSENFEEFMKALGIGLMMRKIGNQTKPSVQFIEENGVWTFKTTSTFKNFEIKFKLGEEVDETTTDGRQCKSTFTLEGNKMIQIQKGVKSKDAKYIREFKDDGTMSCICECDGVVSKRFYRRASS